MCILIITLIHISIRISMYIHIITRMCIIMIICIIMLMSMSIHINIIIYMHIIILMHVVIHIHTLIHICKSCRLILLYHTRSTISISADKYMYVYNRTYTQPTYKAGFVKNVPPEHFRGILCTTFIEGEAGVWSFASQVASPLKCCRISHPLLRFLKIVDFADKLCLSLRKD